MIYATPFARGVVFFVIVQRPMGCGVCGILLVFGELSSVFKPSRRVVLHGRNSGFAFFVGLAHYAADFGAGHFLGRALSLRRDVRFRLGSWCLGRDLLRYCRGYGIVFNRGTVRGSSIGRLSGCVRRDVG